MKNVASIFSGEGEKKERRHYATAIDTFSLEPLRNPASYGRQPPAPEPIKGTRERQRGCLDEWYFIGMFSLWLAQTFQGNTIGPNRPQRRFLSERQAQEMAGFRRKIRCQGHHDRSEFTADNSFPPDTMPSAAPPFCLCHPYGTADPLPLQPVH